MALVKVDKLKLEVEVLLGLTIPTTSNDTSVVTDVVELNPFKIVRVLDTVLWLVDQSRVVPAGIPVNPEQVIVVGTVTVLG